MNDSSFPRPTAVHERRHVNMTGAMTRLQARRDYAALLLAAGEYTSRAVGGRAEDAEMAARWRLRSRR